MNKPRIAVALAALMTLSIAGVALGDAHIAPNANTHETVAGNPKCSGDSAYTLKIEDYELGVGTYGAIQITKYDGKYVSWKIAPAYLDVYDANLVIVKGGPNAEIYHYDMWDDWDTNLTAPWNMNSGKWYGISHIQFCFDPKAS